MEIMSISRDGTVHKVSEAKLVPDDNDHGPKNEIQQWQYTDHEGSLWTVLEKFDGNGMSSTETNAAGDSRTMKDTWSDDGSYRFEMSESIDGETYTETRSGTPSFSDGKYREVEAVVITENSVEIENYTQTLVFNDDFTATRTLIGTLEFMGEIYKDANVVIEQNENWQATAVVSGNATNKDGDTATITMDGNHQWGDPKLVFTVNDTAINDTREVIGNKVADNIDPVAVDDSITIDENQAFIVDVLSNDTDADVDGDGNPRDILSIKSIGAASNGEVNLAGGSLIYTPDYAYTGTDSFTYTVTDGKGGTDQGTVNITVDGVNEAPVAVNDIYTVKSGFGSLVLDLLANDTDADEIGRASCRERV